MYSVHRSQASLSSPDKQSLPLANDELGLLCHDTSDSESVPKNGQVQLWAHARAALPLCYHDDTCGRGAPSVATLSVKVSEKAHCRLLGTARLRLRS